MPSPYASGNGEIRVPDVSGFPWRAKETRLREGNETYSLLTGRPHIEFTTGRNEHQLPNRTAKTFCPEPTPGAVTNWRENGGWCPLKPLPGSLARTPWQESLFGSTWSM